MSSADVQLRLMKWWDGQNWLPEALAQGESVKGGLQLRAGRLALLSVTEVSPLASKDGNTTCNVRVKIRWDFPEALQELQRVQEIVALRFPKGLLPGQAAELNCRFMRQGWRWELVAAESSGGGKLPLPKQVPGPLDWLF
jgi:hypothetical protein